MDSKVYVISTDSEVNALNGALNRLLKKNFDWFKSVTVTFITVKNNPGYNKLASLDGVIYVDEYWLKEKWEKYFSPNNLLNPNEIDIQLGHILRGELARNFAEVVLTATNFIFHGKLDGAIWSNLYIRLDDMKKEEEPLTETIKRVLREEMRRAQSSKSKKVVCSECGWSWKLSEGGHDPYTCHMCGNENHKSELTEKCWPGYTQKGVKTMFGKRYPNCVKKKKK